MAEYPNVFLFRAISLTPILHGKLFLSVLKDNMAPIKTNIVFEVINHFCFPKYFKHRKQKSVRFPCVLWNNSVMLSESQLFL